MRPSQAIAPHHGKVVAVARLTGNEVTVLAAPCPRCPERHFLVWAGGTVRMIGAAELDERITLPRPIHERTP